MLSNPCIAIVNECCSRVTLSTVQLASETELDHAHCFSMNSLAVEHKRHHNLGAAGLNANFCVLKNAPFKNEINFFWHCNYGLRYNDWLIYLVGRVPDLLFA